MNNYKNFLLILIFAFLNIGNIKAAAKSAPDFGYDQEDTKQLFDAITKGDNSSVEDIVSHRSFNPDIKARNTQGLTPLMLATKKNASDIVALLLNVPGIEIDAVDENGDTALIMAARLVNSEIIDLLIDANASTTITNKSGNNYKKEYEIAHGKFFKDSILEIESDLQKNLHDSLQKQDQEAATKFICLGAKITQHEIDQFINTGLKTFILECLDIKKKYEHLTKLEKNSQFLNAIKNGDKNLASELLISGANIYSCTKAGFTALMLAAKSKCLETTMFLIDTLSSIKDVKLLEAYVNRENSNGDSAALIIAEHYSPTIVFAFNRFCTVNNIQSVYNKKNIKDEDFSFILRKSKYMHFRKLIENLNSTSLNQELAQVKTELSELEKISEKRELFKEEQEKELNLKIQIAALIELLKSYDSKSSDEISKKGGDSRDADWAAYQNIFDGIANIDREQIQNGLAHSECFLNDRFFNFNVINWAIINLSNNQRLDLNTELICKGFTIFEWLVSTCQKNDSCGIDFNESLKFAMDKDILACSISLISHGAFPGQLNNGKTTPLIFLLENFQQVRIELIKYVIERSDVNIRVALPFVDGKEILTYKASALCLAICLWKSVSPSLRTKIEQIIELLIMNGADINIRDWKGKFWRDRVPQLTELILKAHSYNKEVMQYVSAATELKLDEKICSKNKSLAPAGVINSYLMNSDVRISAMTYDPNPKKDKEDDKESKEEKKEKLAIKASDSKDNASDESRESKEVVANDEKSKSQLTRSSSFSNLISDDEMESEPEEEYQEITYIDEDEDVSLSEEDEKQMNEEETYF